MGHYMVLYGNVPYFFLSLPSESQREKDERDFDRDEAEHIFLEDTDGLVGGGNKRGAE